MALPNYSPSGIIRMGCVPWDNSYTNVRLYGSLSEQESDISSLMTVSTSDYAYIGRNRRLKVSIEADRLYHVNYCMYKNASLTDGWIYCFVTDVEYINDHTTELTIETDIFQTYLYGVDWTVPPCFIDRMTVPSDSGKYMYTPEPDFSLVQKPYDIRNHIFHPGGYVIMTCEEPEENSNIIETVLNPNGWFGKPAPIKLVKGTVQGAGYWFVPATNDATAIDQVQTFLNGLTFAGAIDSVIAVFTVPSFVTGSQGFLPQSSSQDSTNSYQDTFNSSSISYSMIGVAGESYNARNKKLYYYPYTKLVVSDYNGNEAEYRYEWLDLVAGETTSTTPIDIKYAINPVCQAIVAPRRYVDTSGIYSGTFLTVNCGSQGSWSNNMYQTWLAQNAGRLAAAGAVALTLGVSGLATMANAATDIEAMRIAQGFYEGLGDMESAARSTAGMGQAMAAREMGAKTAMAGGAMAAGPASNMLYQMKMPTVSRGATDYSLMFQTGVQGVYTSRMQVIPEQAELIDNFFDKYGYSVGGVESVNIGSRRYWNYIKTIGSAAKSLNVGSSAGTPHTRGRGTPSDALAKINSMLDGGCTFWHTTSSFGNYSLNNSIS